MTTVKSAAEQQRRSHSLALAMLARQRDDDPVGASALLMAAGLVSLAGTGCSIEQIGDLAMEMMQPVFADIGLVVTRASTDQGASEAERNTAATAGILPFAKFVASNQSEREEV
jgi:hypothetical protein